MRFVVPLERMLSRARSTHPAAVAYFEAQLDRGPDFLERQRLHELALAHAELSFDLLEEVLTDLVRAFPRFAGRSLPKGATPLWVVETLGALLAELPHDQALSTFDEAVEHFYGKSVYPLLEHAIYLSPIGVLRAKEVLRFLAQVPANPVGLLVDLGVGPGVLLARALKALPGWRGLGIDVSEHCVKYARALLKSHGFGSRIAAVSAGDARNLALSAGEARLVIATEIIEHVPDPGALLREVARVLAPGGWLIASTPIALPWGPHLAVFQGEAEVRGLFEGDFELLELTRHSLGGAAELTFGLFRRR